MSNKKDHHCNRELAAIFRGDGMPFPGPWLGRESSYAQTFAGHSTDQLRSAKSEMPSNRMARTHTVGGAGGSFVKSSHAHNQHRPPPRDTQSVPAQRPSPLLAVDAEAIPDTYKTHYNRQFAPEFTPKKAPEAAAAALKEAKLKPDRRHKSREHPMFRVRRSGFLSPGE